MNVGDTFIDRNATAPHLWFVLTTPDANGVVAVVNLTTWHTRCDTTCRLSVGDHPFVTHDSYIFYRGAQVYPQRVLTVALQQGVLVSRAPAAPQLIARIRAGALTSRFTPGKVRSAVAACPWQPP